MKNSLTFSEIVERLGNDVEIARTAIRIFQETSTQLYQRLIDALEQKASTQAADAAHTIKGAISIFGFSDLSKKLKTLELGLRADGVATHLVLANDVLAELRSAKVLLGEIYNCNKD